METRPLRWRHQRRWKPVTSASLDYEKTEWTHTTAIGHRPWWHHCHHYYVAHPAWGRIKRCTLSVCPSVCPPSAWNCRGLGLNPPLPSSCLQTVTFKWKSALNFNPWAKFLTFRHLTPSSFKSIPTLVEGDMTRRRVTRGANLRSKV